MNNLKLIGTTHLWKEEQIINEIKKFNPEIIGVELDELRLNTLVLNPVEQLNETKEETLIQKISKAIHKKAKEENLTYGSDMITASKYAIENKIPLVLVDRNIIEIQNLMNNIPKEEMNGFIKELQLFESQNIKEQIDNLDEDKVINELKTKYPISFEFLVTSRELYIVYKILKCLYENRDKKILIFLGKGHIKGIKKLLEIE